MNNLISRPNRRDEIIQRMRAVSARLAIETAGAKFDIEPLPFQLKKTPAHLPAFRLFFSTEANDVKIIISPKQAGEIPPMVRYYQNGIVAHEEPLTDENWETITGLVTP